MEKDYKKVNDAKFIKTIHGITSSEFAALCKRNIIESNKDVTFYNIRYNVDEYALIFYTDKEIDIDSWNQYSEDSYRKNNTIKILETLKNIKEPNSDENNQISLYDVCLIMNKYAKKYYDIIEKSYKNIKRELINVSNKFKNDFLAFKKEIKKNNTSKYYGYYIEFDNSITKGNKFIISFGARSYYSNCKILFMINNGDISVKWVNINGDVSSQANKLFPKLLLDKISNDLINIYKAQEEATNFLETEVFNIKATNFDISIFIKPKCVEITNRTELFDIFYNCEDGIFSNNSNSAKILTTMNGKEKELFKKIYININDLPKWLQSEVFNLLKTREYENSASNYIEKNIILKKVKDIFKAR